MTIFRFSNRSIQNLNSVDARLALVASRALLYSKVDFVIVEGRRSLERQRKLFEEGASLTMNSKHLEGLAIDVAAINEEGVSYEWHYYELIAKAFDRAARELNIPLRWGGDFENIADGAHFELN